MGTEDISKFNKSFLKMKWAFLKSSEFPVRGVRYFCNTMDFDYVIQIQYFLQNIKDL